MKNKITEAEVIKSSSPDSMNEMMMKKIREGFQPQGGVSSTSIEGNHHHRNYETYSVLMVKSEGE